jgi:hypothetical protein
MKISCFVVLWLVVGCAVHAPNANEQAARKYHRESSRIELIEDFERRKRACSASGGAMQVDRASSGRLPPTIDELRMAGCTGSGSPEGPV